MKRRASRMDAFRPDVGRCTFRNRPAVLSVEPAGMHGGKLEALRPGERHALFGKKRVRSPGDFESVRNAVAVRTAPVTEPEKKWRSASERAASPSPTNGPERNEAGRPSPSGLNGMAKGTGAPSGTDTSMMPTASSARTFQAPTTSAVQTTERNDLFCPRATRKASPGRRLTHSPRTGQDLKRPVSSGARDRGE